jgi:hypothetical protein
MWTATPPPRLGLAAHVRACEVDGQIILLDLRTGKYLGLTQSIALSEHVQGWPGSTPETPCRATSAAVRALAQPLLAQGLLTETTSEACPRTAIEEATCSLDRNLGDGKRDVALNARRIRRFVQSATVTAYWMRCRSLHAIATAVEARRMRLQALRSSPGTPDAMRASTAAYERLRPLVFSAYQHCLYDSLALVGYLALEGAFPRWIIGVQTAPFGAHSWVQCGPMVLNDEHERVRRFRPILVV